MSSTFYGLNIGASALNAYSACTNTMANNVANANTEGYSKQVVNLVASNALRNATYGTLGSGVTAESITQLRNVYYDIKYWANNSNTGQYEKKVYYLSQIENLFTDDGLTKGFTSIYTDMFNSLESLKGDGGNLDIRNAFINNTQSFAEYFNNMYSNLRDIQADCNQEVRAMVSQINSYARQISVLNEKINTLEIQGTHANDLRDQRAVLIDKLSSLVPVEVEEKQVHNSNYPEMYTGATHYTIKIEGQTLVDGDNYEELECYTRTEKVNQNDIEGLYDIRWANTKNEFNAGSDSMSGELKAAMLIRDGNNKENFQGKLAMTNGSTIVVENPNIKTVEAMNMPASGQITVANRTYTYSRFEMSVKIDEDGNESCTYQFDLTGNDLTTLAGKVGRDVSIGKAVDARGIPYYLSQMNEFLRSFCRKINDIQLYGGIDKNGQPMNGFDEDGNPVGGVDAQGNPMGTFIVSMNTDGSENTFADSKYTDHQKGRTTTYASDDGKGGPCGNYFFMTAGNVTVNGKSLKDPNYFSTAIDTEKYESHADLVDMMLDLQTKTVVYRGAGGNSFLQYITDDVSVDANEANILYANYSDISNTIDTYRMSVSSVDEDEEGLDLIKFQNAYNLASRIISTMNQMFDRLITQTGV